jgi:hypothetical protein
VEKKAQAGWGLNPEQSRVNPEQPQPDSDWKTNVDSWNKQSSAIGWDELNEKTESLTLKHNLPTKPKSAPFTKSKKVDAKAPVSSWAAMVKGPAPVVKEVEKIVEVKMYSQLTQ